MEVNEEEQLKLIREENRIRRKEQRDSETNEQTIHRRATEAKRQREKRSQESEEEGQLRRNKSALAKRLNRANADEEVLNYRRAIEAENQRQKRALRVMSESPEQKILRKRAEAERQRLRRANETEEQKAERKRKGAEAIALRRWNQSVQESGLLSSMLKQEMEESSTSNSTPINVIYERYIFGSAVQLENETIIQFIERLKHLSNKCDYQEMTDDLIRDRIILGIRDDAMRKMFLSNKFLTLQNVILFCESLEIVNSNCNIKTEPITTELIVNVKTEPDLEIDDSHSGNLIVEFLPIKEESCSPIHEAETIEIITDEDEQYEEIDLSFLNDIKTYPILDMPKYSCNICDETFFEIKYLTTHIRNCKKNK